MIASAKARWRQHAEGAARRWFLFAVSVLPIGGPARAQNAYPTKPVRMIVPFAPAGPTDVIARLLAQKLSARLGQQFYVENQAGAGGNLGMGNAARAPRRRLFASSSCQPSFIVNPQPVRQDVPYDPYKDFVAGHARIATSPNVLVRASVGAGQDRQRAGRASSRPIPANTRLRLRRPRHARRICPASCSSCRSKLDLVHDPVRRRRPGDRSRWSPATRRSRSPSMHARGRRRSRPACCARSPSRRRSARRRCRTCRRMAEAGLPGSGGRHRCRAFWCRPARRRRSSTLLHREIRRCDGAAGREGEAWRRSASSRSPDTPAEFAALRPAPRCRKWGKVIRDANIKPE